MKIILKLFITILTILVISSAFPVNYIYAGSVDDIISDADGFIQSGTGTQPININDFSSMSDTIYNILLVIAIVVAVIIGSAIGIKFMTGSVVEKANIKETLIPYIAGCIVVFGAFAIWKLVVNILKAM